jgi:hypothetical protein
MENFFIWSLPRGRSPYIADEEAYTTGAEYFLDNSNTLIELERLFALLL